MKNLVAEANNYNSFKFIKPQDALENKEYYCPDPQCKDPGRKLYLRKSSLNRKYFAHRVGKEHEIHPKTLLHKLLVGYFTKITSYKLPQIINGKESIDIDHQKSIIDFKGLEGDVPDVLLEDKDGFKCFVEVTLGFPINKKKVDAVKKLNIPLIELNIIQFYAQNKEKLKDNVDFFFEHVPKLVKSPAKAIFLPSDAKTDKKSVKNTSVIIGGAVLLGAAGLATYIGYKTSKK